MSELFVVWSDFDTTECAEYPGRTKEALAKIALIMRNEEKGDYGAHLFAVIEGRKLQTEVVSRIDGVELKEVRDEGAG